MFAFHKFQSTLPRGSDSLRLTVTGAPLCDFNPRSLAGATVMVITSLIPTLNFNPRSLAGATICQMTNVVGWKYFNPRSLAGATKQTKFCSRKCKISIHAPSRERPRVYRNHRRCFDFNPRSLAGATTIDPNNVVVKFLFQSTLPRGSDA